MDAKTRSVLSGLKEVTEVRDANGTPLGMYTPTDRCDERSSKHLLILFDDGRTVLLDLKRVRETLAGEKLRARPFREMIAKLETLASPRSNR